MFTRPKIPNRTKHPLTVIAEDPLGEYLESADDTSCSPNILTFPKGIPHPPAPDVSITKRLKQLHYSLLTLNRFRTFYASLSTSLSASLHLSSHGPLSSVLRAADQLITFGARELERVEELQEDVEYTLWSNAVRMRARDVSIKFGVEGAAERRRDEKGARWRSGEMKLKEGWDGIRRFVDCQWVVVGILERMAEVVVGVAGEVGERRRRRREKGRNRSGKGKGTEDKQKGAEEAESMTQTQIDMKRQTELRTKMSVTQGWPERGESTTRMLRKEARKENVKRWNEFGDKR